MFPESVGATMPSTKSGLKRDRAEDNVDDETARKRHRRSCIIVSLAGTNTDRLAVPSPDKDTVKNVDAQVLVVSHAMEMVTYGPGVVHVINTLIVGTSSLYYFETCDC